MAEGWYVTTTRPDPKGGPDLQGRFLVRVSDRRAAILIMSSKYPDALIMADQEATLEQLDKYGVRSGEVANLWEAQ